MSDDLPPRDARASTGNAAAKSRAFAEYPIDAADTQVTTNARPALSAGGRLRAAREAAGLSVDAVAQQLKLAPRQVKALEDDDWQRLPGRTFVRGFARNYARFVQLDPDAVVALLPASDAAPALERPALATSRRPMGEIPVERVARPSAARWLIPLLLLAVIGAVGYFQLSRSSFHLPAMLSSATPETNEAATSTGATTPGPAATPGAATSALPNPVAGSTPAVTDAAAPSAAATAAPPSPSGTEPAANAAVSAGAGTSAAASATPANAGAAASAAPSSTASTAAGEASLVLAFKGTSWAEVKDAKGRVVLQMTGGPGMTQTVNAMPPLELSLGNAPGVGVTFRGQSLDLSPYTRGNVARVSLQ